jgi:hypothetical protein
MARHLKVETQEDGRVEARRGYIDAIISTRAPPPVDDHHLLAKVDSKTAQHRTPYSANVSRAHASILSALSPPGEQQPHIGKKVELAPAREATQRRGFQVLEWEMDREPLPPEVLATEEEEDVPEPPPARPALTKYVASLKEDEEEVEATPEPSPVEPAEEELEPADLVVGIEVEAPVAPVGEEETPEEGEEAPEEVEEAPEPVPEPEEDVVVEGRPGHRPREGGEFPQNLMEHVDEAGTEAAARPSRPREDEEPGEGIISFAHETDFSEDMEEPAGEVETMDSVRGAAPAHRWPSETGLELHIDGFEDIAAMGDVCPRCGRRISARNRLLTCTDCGIVSCEVCEMRTSASVDSPYYYDWRFELPLCIRCYDKAYSIQKSLAKAKASLGMGNLTYAYFHAKQALKRDPSSPYAKEANDVVSQIDRRRRQVAEQDEAWKKQRKRLSRTSVFHEE